MKNKLMIAAMVIFSSTIMVAIELPDYAAQELERTKNNAKNSLENLYSDKWKHHQFWIDTECESIREALRMIEFSNSQANTEHPDEISKILPCEINKTPDEDMKNLKHEFYTELQTVSQEKAKEYIKKYATQGDFYQAAQVVNMQKKLCNNFIKAANSDYTTTNKFSKEFHCTTIDRHLKTLLGNEIQTRDETLKTQIQNAPHILAKDIQQMTERSEKDILNKKQERQKLQEIWTDLITGEL